MAILRHKKTFLDNFRRAPAAGWFLVFAAATPWFRVEWGAITLYPGHLLLSGLLIAGLARAGGERRNALAVRGGTSVPLKSALLLAIFLCAMAAVRGQWHFLAFSGVTLALNYGWGWAAYQLGRSQAATGAAGDGLVLLLAATLPMGVAAWGAALFWPPFCGVLNCPKPFLAPFVFQGGWGSTGQYLFFLLLLLPAGWAFLIFLHRHRRRHGARNVLAAILAGCGLGMLAGAKIWALLLFALALLFSAVRLRRAALPGDGSIFKGALAVAAIGALVIYGLFPGYLTVAAGRGAEPGVLRIENEAAPPARLSSERATAIRLRLGNPGVVSVPGGRDSQTRLTARLLLTPRRGRARAFDAASVPLPAPIAPGRSAVVTLNLRLPHWAREGFVAWVAETSRGQDIRLADDSTLGFRFVNRGFRALEAEKDNQLTALAARARDFAARTFVPEGRPRNPDGLERLIGESLDTLFFSPLWGLAAAGGKKRFPFDSPRPFWAQVFQEYGAIALLLAGILALGMFRRSLRIAARFVRSPERIGWQIVPVTIAALVLTGFFSPVLGSYHGVWGLFIFAGYIEGKHDLWFARIPSQLPKKSLWPWRRAAGFGRRRRPVGTRRPRLR